MRLSLITLLCSVAASTLYTAEDCSFPSAGATETKVWTSSQTMKPSFQLSLVSPECLDKLMEIYENCSAATKTSLSSSFKISPLLPLPTKQHIISKGMGVNDVPKALMPEGEDCDKLNFKDANENFIKNLASNSKCRDKLSDTSAASLAENRNLAANLHLYVSLLLKNEVFLSKQNYCDLNSENPWCLPLLKEIDETKVEDSYSEILNRRIYQFKKYEFEGKTCSESHMLVGGVFDKDKCKGISPRCYHHITKNVQTLFTEVTEKCMDHLLSVHLRLDTLQLALDTKCLPIMAKFLSHSKIHCHPFFYFDLSKICGDILANMEVKEGVRISGYPDAIESLKNNANFKFIKSFEIFKPSVSKDLIPFMTLEQVGNMSADYLRELYKNDGNTVFLNDQVRDAFLLKIGKITSSTDKTNQPGGDGDGATNTSKNDSNGEGEGIDPDKDSTGDGSEKPKKIVVRPPKIDGPKTETSSISNQGINARKDDGKQNGNAATVVSSSYLLLSFFFIIFLGNE